jgi:hypothetical protein
MTRRLLKGDALAAFDRAAEENGGETNHNYDACMKALAAHVIPRRALRLQKRYMCRYMRKPRDVKIRPHVARVKEMSAQLDKFPAATAGPHRFTKDELIDIVDHGNPSRWQCQMTLQGFDPQDHTLEELIEFCKRIEATEPAEETTSTTGPKMKSSGKQKQLHGTKKRKASECMYHA